LDVPNLGSKLISSRTKLKSPSIKLLMSADCLSICVPLRKTSFNAAMLYLSVPCVRPAFIGEWNPDISPSDNTSIRSFDCLLDNVELVVVLIPST